MQLQRRFQLTCVMAAIMATSGCKLPVATHGVSEGIVKAGMPAEIPSGELRQIKLKLADGTPVTAGTVMIDGRSYTVDKGVLSVPSDVLTAAQQAGNLVLVVPGYVPMRVDPQTALQGGVTLAPLQTLATSLPLDSAGGKLATADGKIAVMVPAGIFDQSGTVTLGAYTPAPGGSALAGEYAQDLATLYKARGLGVPPAGGCTAPLACLPIQQALGLSVTTDGTLTSTDNGGTLTATVDLAKMLNGWDGKGTPPWQNGATGWTDQQKADALAAAQILNTYRAMGSSSDSGWTGAMKNTFGLTLNGTVLTFPIAADPTALGTGITTVRVPGSELLGTSLEVTLTTPDINTSSALGGSALNIDPASVVLPDGTSAAQILATDQPQADPSGAAALKAQSSISLNGVTRPGSSLATGLSLDVSSPGSPTNAVGATTSQLSAGTQGTGATAGGSGTLSAGQIPGLTGTTANAMSLQTLLANTSLGLVANNAAGIVSNNNGGIVSNNNGGIVSNNNGGLVSNNSGGLVSNNSGGLVSNNAGGIVANNSGQLISGSGLMTPVGQKMISQDDSGLVANNAAGIIANNAGMLTGYPYVPQPPELAKYDLLQVGVPAPPYTRVSPTGLQEWLWGGLGVRAIDVEGNPLTDWVYTDESGKFNLPVDGQSPPIFFLEVAAPNYKIHVYSMVFSPGSGAAAAAVDSDTTQLAISTIELYNFCPPEANRMNALYNLFMSSSKKASSLAGNTSKKSSLFKRLTSSAKQSNTNALLCLAREQELIRSFNAIDPTQFQTDWTTNNGVLTQDTAIKNATAKTTSAIYNTLYSETSARQLQVNSLLPITLISPF